MRDADSSARTKPSVASSSPATNGDPPEPTREGNNWRCTCGQLYRSDDKLCAQCRRYWDEGPAVWGVYAANGFKQLRTKHWDQLNPRNTARNLSKPCKNCHKVFSTHPSHFRRAEFCGPQCRSGFWKDKNKQDARRLK